MPKLTHLAKLSLLPLTLACAFSIILLSLPLLASPRGPGRAQRIGWQAWDVVRYPKPLTDLPDSAGLLDPAEAEEEDDGFAPSLPLDTWDPLKRHTTGITQVTAVGCMFPPWLYPSLCSPKSTAEEDKLLGRWVRVERDLNWKTGLWYLNVYYRRTRRFDAPLITDLLLLPEGAAPPYDVNLSQYVQAQGDFRDGVYPKKGKMRLWYKVRAGYSEGKTRVGSGMARSGSKVAKRSKWWQWDANDDEEEEDTTEEDPTNKDETPETASTGMQEIITELDVLYGEQQPFFGFERVKNGPVLPKDSQGKVKESVDLVFRRGNPPDVTAFELAENGVVVPPLAPPPRFHPNGTYKILQIADLHYSVSDGVCRDTPKRPCIGDPDTGKVIAEVLDAERPDLVVFSGDQLNGQGTSWDSKSVIAKFGKEVIDRGIAWTAIFDVIKIRSADPSRIHLFTLYFLDSHSHQPRKLPWQWPDYDYIKPSQIAWFKEESKAIRAIERPFTPDGADDLGKIWKPRRAAGKTNPGKEGSGKSRFKPEQDEDKTLAKPNAIMFFHIPLAQSYGPVDEDRVTGLPLDVGTQLPGDGPGNSKTDAGMFDDGLLKTFEVDDQEEEEEEGKSVRVPEVKVIGHGHSHNTDKCRRNHGVWACFGGGGSYSGYGDKEFERRFRIYQLSDYGETIETYKRTESGKIVDPMVLVGKGAPAPYQP
ncbi:hypothetical protein QFC21_005863 [Naganishia friedmannii]|uniref:Uncharacterized protein n=1 Tax=Naganishia friedmannii TaxID=89922 RepID=A0ACC2V7U3_9TREE|nr:hypothetical protein QFC21_005863 [Naganishia friedmannii]